MWREPKQLLSGVAQIALAYSDREDPLCSTSHSGSFRFETISQLALCHLERLPERFADRKQPDSKRIRRRQEVAQSNLTRQSQRLQPQRQRHQGQLVRFVLRP